MKKIKFFSIGLCFALVLAGCNNTQKGAAIGAGGGAVPAPDEAGAGHCAHRSHPSDRGSHG